MWQSNNPTSNCTISRLECTTKTTPVLKPMFALSMRSIGRAAALHNIFLFACLVWSQMFSYRSISTIMRLFSRLNVALSETPERTQTQINGTVVKSGTAAMSPTVCINNKQWERKEAEGEHFHSTDNKTAAREAFLLPSWTDWNPPRCPKTYRWIHFDRSQ